MVGSHIKDPSASSFGLNLPEPYLKALGSVIPFLLINSALAHFCGC